MMPTATNSPSVRTLVVEGKAIGSETVALLWNWDYNMDVSTFWRTLLDRYASKVSVQELTLGPQTVPSRETMCTALPKLRHLKELHMTSQEIGYVSDWSAQLVRKLVGAVWQSGSLLKLTLDGVFPVVLNRATQHANIVQNAFVRNCMLPQMLAVSPEAAAQALDNGTMERVPHADNVAAGHAEEDAAAADVDGTEPQLPLVQLSKFPRLFYLSQQAPPNGPHSLLTGLLALSKSSTPS
jgi:hypothetical protein